MPENTTQTIYIYVEIPRQQSSSHTMKFDDITKIRQLPCTIW